MAMYLAWHSIAPNRLAKVRCRLKKASEAQAEWFALQATVPFGAVPGPKPSPRTKKPRRRDKNVSAYTEFFCGYMHTEVHDLMHSEAIDL